MFGKKKAGKSTFIEKIFKECKTNSSHDNSTIGLNLYTIKDVENFGIIDSPGDTENDNILELFSSKGYLYSKMLIYIIAERGVLNADDIRNNNKLITLLKLREEYKIPLLILLTHSDTYCDEAKKRFEEKINSDFFSVDRLKNTEEIYAEKKQARDTLAVEDFTKSELFQELYAGLQGVTQ